MRTILSSLAAKELVEESQKYEKKAPSLGSLFVDEFEASVQMLQGFPESGPAFGPHFRRILMKRFPFFVVYAVATDALRIVSIMHQHRGPEFIASRLKQESSDT